MTLNQFVPIFYTDYLDFYLEMIASTNNGFFSFLSLIFLILIYFILFHGFLWVSYIKLNKKMLFLLMNKFLRFYLFI